MIAALGISLSYGERALLDDATFHIGARDRIGLVGANGAGKSTLLRILMGEVAPESGEVRRAKFVKVGCLAQEMTTCAGRTLFAEVQSAFGSVLEIEQRLEAVQARLGEAQDDTELADLLEICGELQHRLEESDAFRIEAAVKAVLFGLGFRATDLARSTDEFSGGWQMRIQLAKLLLSEPSLLLLDEPTNHLDLDSLEWVEAYIRDYRASVMLVSHDRRFLDNMTTRTFELSLGKLTSYAGNYSFFVDAKAERQALQEAAFRNQQQHIKQTERFIDRFRYQATKARQVQSRIKQLEKVERIELEEDDGEIAFRFPPAPPCSKVALTLTKMSKTYGALRVFDDASLTIERGDRIALVGVNGAGKSTFARIVAGVEGADGGERRLGHNASVAYFAQHQADELDASLDALATVQSVVPNENPRRLRTMLGSFLFRGDDVFKRVAVLSGGEKSRLALAKMLLQPSNVLVLDEPTNHLDLRSKAVLQFALAEFSGSCVIVSHDRDFLDPLVNKVVEFRDGRLTLYLGNVSDYLQARPPPVPVEKPAASSGDGRKAQRRLDAETRRKQSAERRTLEKQVAALEATIAAKEREKATLEASLADPTFYRSGEAKAASQRYREIEAELAIDFDAWQRVSLALEAAVGANRD